MGVDSSITDLSGSSSTPAAETTSCRSKQSSGHQYLRKKHGPGYSIPFAQVSFGCLLLGMLFLARDVVTEGERERELLTLKHWLGSCTGLGARILHIERSIIHQNKFSAKKCEVDIKDAYADGHG